MLKLMVSVFVPSLSDALKVTLCFPACVGVHVKLLVSGEMPLVVGNMALGGKFVLVKEIMSARSCEVSNAVMRIVIGSFSMAEIDLLAGYEIISGGMLVGGSFCMMLISSHHSFPDLVDENL